MPTTPAQRPNQHAGDAEVDPRIALKLTEPKRLARRRASQRPQVAEVEEEGADDIAAPLEGNSPEPEPVASLEEFRRINENMPPLDAQRQHEPEMPGMPQESESDDDPGDPGPGIDPPLNPEDAQAVALAHMLHANRTSAALDFALFASVTRSLLDLLR